MDTVSNVDELVELLYPEYSLVQHCLRRKALHTSPPLHAEDDIWAWGKPRELALVKSDSTIEGKALQLNGPNNSKHPLRENVVFLSHKGELLA